MAASIPPAPEPPRYFTTQQLAEAYSRGNDIALLLPLGATSERDLRAAATTLSPFDADRLGTFDWLTKIEESTRCICFSASACST